MSTFSVVATPIGNLDDITLRALKVLSGVDLILCEDTRTTKRLLDHHSIKTPTRSYHVHSKLSRKDEIAGLLRDGKDLALVSDAGTPGISDPGIELIKFLRQELSALLEDGTVKIETIPGPSALTASIAIAGAPCSDFSFLGFLPHKKGRETIFKEISSSQRTMIFYESPHRIMKTLDSLVVHCNTKTVIVCRELTKIFEEVVKGRATEVRDHFIKNPDRVKGEFVVLVFDEK